jgi:hypothetical protein
MSSWEEDSPRNKCGKAAALTTLAPVSVWRLWQPRLFFWYRRLTGPPQDLTDLSFIYYARTAFVTRIERRRPYIYFESNFNGSFDEYIDVFSYVVDRHMKRIWSSAKGFPGPQPSTVFKEYIRRHDFQASHYYCAYGDATVTEVVRALQLRDRLAKLVRHIDTAEPDAFAARWSDLWSTIPRLELPGFSPLNFLPRDTNRAHHGQAYGLTVLTPIKPGRAHRMRDEIERLSASPSPFAAVGGTHFARLVVLDGYPFAAPPHLLFSAIVDRDGDAYARRLARAIPDTVHAVWQHCQDETTALWRDPQAFSTWLRRGQITSKTFFAPYGQATVDDVRDALALRRRALTFARETQYEPAHALQAGFANRFPARELLR